MASDKVRWGVLSTAKIAREKVMPAIQQVEDAVIHGIASRDVDRAKEVAEDFGIPNVYGRYEDLLEDPDIDAVYIPLPNHLHKEWTIKAAQAGKHVLCEKPLSITGGECQAMIDVCQKQGVLLMEGFMYSLHPQMDSVLEILEKCSIGYVKLVRGRFSFAIGTSANIRLEPDYGGGSLMDVGCYPIHFANRLFRQAPKKAYCAALWEGGVDVSAQGILTYDGERAAILDSSFAMFDRQEMEVVGKKGRIVLNRPWRADDFEVEVMVETDEGREVHKLPAQNPYQLEIRHFQDCMVHRRTPVPDPKKGKEVVRTIEALLESARTGREIELEDLE